MKKSKNGCHFVNINMEKFQNTDPLKVWVSSFPIVNRNGISPLAIIKKNQKIAKILLTSIIDLQKNFQLPNPLKFGSPVLWVLRETEYQHQPLWKKSKNDCYFVNIDCTKKFQITDPPQVWVSSFPSVNGNGISLSAIIKKSNKWPPFCQYQSYGNIPNYSISFNTRKTGDLNFGREVGNFNFFLLVQFFPVTLHYA